MSNFLKSESIRVFFMGVLVIANVSWSFLVDFVTGKREWG